MDVSEATTVNERMHLDLAHVYKGRLTTNPACQGGTVASPARSPGVPTARRARRQSGRESSPVGGLGHVVPSNAMYTLSSPAGGTGLRRTAGAGQNCGNITEATMVALPWVENGTAGVVAASVPLQ